MILDSILAFKEIKKVTTAIDCKNKPVKIYFLLTIRIPVLIELQSVNWFYCLESIHLINK